MFVKTPEERLAKKFSSALFKVDSECIEAISVYLDYCERWLAAGKTFKVDSRWTKFGINLGKFADVNNNERLNVVPCTDPGYIPFYLTRYSEHGCQVMSPDLPDEWHPPICPEIYNALRERGLKKNLEAIFDIDDFSSSMRLYKVYEPETVKTRTHKSLACFIANNLAQIKTDQELEELCRNTRGRNPYIFNADHNEENFFNEHDWVTYFLCTEVEELIQTQRQNIKSVKTWQPLKV